jgi:hypothetical protein
VPETVPGRRAQAREVRTRVVALRRDRLTFDQIGAALGVTKQRAYQLYREVLAEIPAAEVAEHRAEELLLIDDAIADLLPIARDHVRPRTSVEAWRAILGWAERKSRLLGLDMPVRTATQVTIDGEVERDIERLVAELLAMPATIAAEALPVAPAKALPAGDAVPGHRGPSRMLAAGC